MAVKIIKESDQDSVTYRVLNTLHVKEYADNDLVYDEYSKDLGNDEGSIRDAIKSDEVDLAEYLDSPLDQIITSIKMDVHRKGDDLYGLATIKAKRDLSEKEKKELLDYLSGQYSDGWGEGFEQTPYDEYTDEDPDDPDEEVRYEKYVSFWNSHNFKIWFES